MLLRVLCKLGIGAVLVASQTSCFGLFGNKLKPPPEPTSRSAARPLPDVQPSMLSARFAIPIGWIRDSIDAFLPRESIGTEAWSQPFVGNEGFQTKHALFRRAMTLASEAVPADRALLHNAIEFKLRARQRLANKWRPEVGCASGSHATSLATLVRGKLAIMTSFAVRPNWSLQPVSNLVGVSTDACPIQLRDVNLSDVLNRLVSKHLTGGLAAIDSANGGRLNFAELIAPLWERAQEPITVDKGVNLVLNPKGARVSPLVVTHDSVIGTIGIVAAPTLWIGAKPRVPAARPLPELEVGRVDSVFVLRTAIVLSDSAIRRAIADTLVGMKLTRRFGPFRLSSTVKDVGFYAAGDTAVVKVTLEGRLRGDVYAMGVPTYDPKTRVFMLKDVSMTAESANFLTRAALATGKGELERKIERSARVELGTRLDSLEKQLDNIADQDLPQVRLRVDVKDISPVGIFRVREGFATVVNLRGAARITGREP